MAKLTGNCLESVTDDVNVCSKCSAGLEDNAKDFMLVENKADSGKTCIDIIAATEAKVPFKANYRDRCS